MSYAENYARVLTEKEIHHSGVEQRENGREMVEFSMSTDTTKVRVKAFFSNNTVAVRMFGIVKVVKDKFGDVLLACNELNGDFRFSRFYIDEDDEVVLAADMILDEASAGDTTFQLVVTLVDIVDDAFPKLQKALWS